MNSKYEEKYRLKRTADSLYHLYWEGNHEEVKIGTFKKYDNAISAMNSFIQDRQSKLVVQTYIFDAFGGALGIG